MCGALPRQSAATGQSVKFGASLVVNVCLDQVVGRFGNSPVPWISILPQGEEILICSAENGLSPRAAMKSFEHCALGELSRKSALSSFRTPGRMIGPSQSDSGRGIERSL